ncbi:MAG: XRE family transcriptional regulator [Ignavibacteriae bacterium]|nr:MAG: XRE family transcriptional regulator [Ignavibacteriota bacterium]
MKSTKEIMDRAAKRAKSSPEALYRRMLNRLIQSVEVAMKIKGINQSELAEKINMPQPQLSAILSGKNSPTLGTIARIAFALEDEYLVRFPLHEQKIAELEMRKRQAVQLEHFLVEEAHSNNASVARMKVSEGSVPQAKDRSKRSLQNETSSWPL